MGKTTCAAAYAVAAARAGRAVLAISTDPAHSLGDALGARLSSRVTPVPFARGRTLSAIELDAPRAFARWLREHGRALGDIVEHGTWLERDDVEALMELSIPGIDELIGMLEIVRLARSPSPAAGSLRSRPRSSARGGGAPRAAEYDSVVVDTAPTGHALRLLSSPDAVSAVVVVLEELQHEHRIIREQLARVGRPEAADRLIALLGEQARQTAELLRNRAGTVFHWVTLPEELALAETADALRALAESGLHVDEIIVNRVTPAGPPCPMCDRRRLSEHTTIGRLARTVAPARRVRRVDAELKEPRGISALLPIGDRLVQSSDADSAARPLRRPRRSGTFAPRSPSRLAIRTLQGAPLLFCGGKGGVGKTTVAATLALGLARQAGSGRILLLSTDPAHSLGDVFAAPAGDAPRPIRGGPANLYVRELDAQAALAARRGPLEAALREIAESFGARGIVSSGSQGVTELMELAPPGIDELFGVLSVVEAQQTYRSILVDTAPTGHALRLLEMPDAAREWVQALLRVLLKYRNVVPPGQLASELVELSRQIRALQDLLHDPARTRFIVVTRAAELPRLETERLLTRLRRLHISAPILIVNALTLAPGTCPRCRATFAGEQRELTRIRRACRRRSGECVIIQTPLVAPPPRGLAALERWARTWIA